MNRRRTYGEGSTYQRASDGRWVGSLRYEDPLTGAARRTTVYGVTEREVVRKIAAIRRRIDAGAPAKDVGVPLDAYASSWIESTLEVSDRKASTKTLYAGLTRTHIIGSPLGALGLKKINPQAVERFLLALRSRGSPTPRSGRSTRSPGRSSTPLSETACWRVTRSRPSSVPR